MTEDLFGNIDASPTSGLGGTLSDATHGQAPLAVRLRPRNIEEIVGQQHLLLPGSPLRRLAEGQPMSIFLWGPPGVGKTTIASVIANSSKSRFVEISAVTAGVKDVRKELDIAKKELVNGRATVLFVDEVHRFSKAQQDVLLPAVENRLVTLIAATTENPSFSVISPLLSRSLLLTLQPLADADLDRLIDRALVDERGLPAAYPDIDFELPSQARETLKNLAGGDARRLLTFLEESAAGVAATEETIISTQIIERSVDRAALRYDKDGDQHYDVVSAFIKSMRGSDVDAALHYLARMIEAGEDPRFIARRLIVLASEDIGMAAPSVLQTCVAAAQAVQLIGMPEARLNLAQATVACALAPKSNAVYRAIDAALADVRSGKIGQVPEHLRDAHYAGAKALGHGKGYIYPHEIAAGVAAQQYLPDELIDATYYLPSDHGNEANIARAKEQIDQLLRPIEHSRESGSSELSS
ncbi:MAG: replication-associated recombination protein A [Propionibacteriaceae bacterium]